MNPPPPPQKLIHYTTAKVAASILLNKELWLSNSRDMNDISEIEHGWRVLDTDSSIAEAIRKHGLRENLESWKDDFIKNTYFSCFSEFKNDHEEREGRLSMWRGYGGEYPVGIVFNTQVLQGLQGHSSHSFWLDKICYRQNEQRDKVLVAIDRNEPTEETDPIKVADALQPTFYQLPYFTKHFGFEEEHEWRLLYAPSQDPLQMDEFEPAIAIEWNIDDEANPIRQIAKLNFTRIRDEHASNSINNVDYKDLIREIIIGPMPCYDQLNIENNLRQIAYYSDFKKVEVHRSTIPYRGKFNRVP